MGTTPDKKDWLLDDGTGVLALRTGPKERARVTELFGDALPPLGAYVAAVGKLERGNAAPGGGDAAVKLRWRRLDNLGGCPDREALWLLETMEVWSGVLTRGGHQGGMPARAAAGVPQS